MYTARIRRTRRARHLVGDTMVICWIALMFMVGWGLKSMIDQMAQPVSQIGRTTDSLADRVADTSGDLSRIQLIGEQLAAPLTPIARTLRDISLQSEAQANTIQQFGWWMFVILAVLPTLGTVLLYFPRRIRHARAAAAARNLINDAADLRLFALRAMTWAPMQQWIDDVLASNIPDWATPRARSRTYSWQLPGRAPTRPPAAPAVQNPLFGDRNITRMPDMCYQGPPPPPPPQPSLGRCLGGGTARWADGSCWWR